MNSTVSATKARVHFGEILKRVENNEIITVERAGEPRAVILSFEEYERLKTETPEQGHEEPDWWKRALEVRERIGRRDVDVDGIIHEMREERSEELLNNLY